MRVKTKIIRARGVKTTSPCGVQSANDLVIVLVVYRSRVAHGQRVARFAGGLALDAVTQEAAVVGRGARRFLRSHHKQSRAIHRQTSCLQYATSTQETRQSQIQYTIHDGRHLNFGQATRNFSCLVSYDLRLDLVTQMFI